MKPKCNNCRGLYQESNEKLKQSTVNSNFYCAYCYDESEQNDAITVIQELEKRENYFNCTYSETENLIFEEDNFNAMVNTYRNKKQK